MTRLQMAGVLNLLISAENRADRAQVLADKVPALEDEVERLKDQLAAAKLEVQMEKDSRISAEKQAKELLAEVDRLRSTQTPAGLVKWPTVLAFAISMTKRLDYHENKKGGREGWQHEDPARLLNHLKEEVNELAFEFSKKNGEPDNQQIYTEAADVGNMAMMVVDASVGTFGDNT